MTLDCDVIIIGGGPAGSATGAYLSKAGISNMIVESAVHPREHVGESMVTASTRVFDELGFLPTMERKGFVHKYGATWHAPAGRGTFSIEFGEFPQDDIHQSYTYHVDRAQFDHALLQHAESLGSTVHQGLAVDEVLLDERGFTNGVAVTRNGRREELRSKLVVDASGRRTLLGSQLGLKKKDPLFDQYAVHAWFEDVARGGDATAEHIHIYFLEVERGWAWQIPITDTITSMGVVAEKSNFREAKGDHAGMFAKLVQSNDNLRDAMAPAKRVNDFKTEGDYSYSMTKFAGDGFVLVGDAARFVDPIFSSGVSVALYSAKFASESIVAALKTGDVSEAAFQPYEKRLRAGVEIWYEFIRLYYKLLPLFTYFIQSKKHRLQVLRLLQGEVFDRTEVPVLDAMREFIAQAEKSDKHAFSRRLTDVPVDDADAN
ncbi:MAG: FAD-binding protein [Planctomycetota bacterium]|nr:MAG: FAD-binding protein [Planctomycetota bacterium]